MTVMLGGQTISLPAAADLEDASQFRFAAVDANGRGTIAGEGAQVIGICQNKPNAQDRGMAIQVDGTSKLLIHASVNEGALLASNAVGAGTATTQVGYQYGAIALEAGGSGAYIHVLVTPGGRSGTA